MSKFGIQLLNSFEEPYTSLFQQIKKKVVRALQNSEFWLCNLRKFAHSFTNLEIQHVKMFIFFSCTKLLGILYL